MSPETKSPEADVIVKKNGEPFRAEQNARVALRKHNLSEKEWQVRKMGAGFCIVRMPSVTSPKEESSTETGVPEDEEYFRIKCHDKAHPNDLPHVEVGVNGEFLKIQRNVEVVIPARFREALEHAEYNQYTHRPGEQRKVAGKVKIFPFDVLGKGTREEYLKMRTEGTLADKATWDEEQR